MEYDDIPIGRVLTRREALAFLGATGALLFFGCSDSTAANVPGDGNSACLVRPELTEGPYYVDEQLNRSDIRSDPGTGLSKEGALLALSFNVTRASSTACEPLADAIVDVWHCDAQARRTSSRLSSSSTIHSPTRYMAGSLTSARGSGTSGTHRMGSTTRAGRSWCSI